MLEVFRDALTEKRWPALLELLLDDWRKHRDPRVAELVELVSTCVDEFLECPGGTNPQRRLEQWTQFLDPKEPRTLRPALRALERWKRPQLETALATLATWPDDPRLSHWHDEALNGGILELHVPALVKRGDVRALARLRPLQRELSGTFTRQALVEDIDTAIDALRKTRVIETWTAEDLSTATSAVNAFLEARRKSRSELFAAVYARPLEDGPRAVLADFLLELGDVRGEFIALQLAHGLPSDRKKVPAREKELLELWGERWVEPLSDAVLKGTVFRRGFPAACELRDADPTLHALEWATLERVFSFGLGARDPGSFFSAKRFPALRTLGPVDPSLLATPEPLAIETLSVTWCSDAEFSRFIASASFPHVRSLRIDAQARFDAMLLDRVPATSALRELICNISASAVSRWARMLATHRGPLTRVVVSGLGSSWQWTLEPSGKGLRVSDATWSTAELEAEHRALPLFAAS
ncbi:MAG: TIGR02996 domain-containing protein [Archangium sp.]|nr:TIGR02996 domain-containing protein [Archangium sp.]